MPPATQHTSGDLKFFPSFFFFLNLYLSVSLAISPAYFLFLPFMSPWGFAHREMGRKGEEVGEKA